MASRAFRAVLLAGLAGLVLAACGGTADDGGDPASGQGTVPSGGDTAVSSTDGSAGGTSVTEVPGVHGQVTDGSGQPVAGALVTPRSLDTPSTPIPEVAVFTDAEGGYRWVLPAGRYRITASAQGYEEATADIAVPAGGAATLDLELTPA